MNRGPLFWVSQFLIAVPAHFWRSTPAVFWTLLCMFRWVSCSTFLQIFSSLLLQYLTEADESSASKNVRSQQSFSPPPLQNISSSVMVFSWGSHFFHEDIGYFHFLSKSNPDKKASREQLQKIRLTLGNECEFMAKSNIKPLLAHAPAERKAAWSAPPFRLNNGTMFFKKCIGPLSFPWSFSLNIPCTVLIKWTSRCEKRALLFLN